MQQSGSFESLMT